MTKLAPEWVRTSDPVIRSPARYRWTTAPADITHWDINIVILVVIMFTKWSLSNNQNVTDVLTHERMKIVIIIDWLHANCSNIKLNCSAD